MYRQLFHDDRDVEFILLKLGLVVVLTVLGCGDENPSSGNNMNNTTNGNHEVVREYAPTADAGGPPCNDGFSSALECEPRSVCAKPHTADDDGTCQELATGAYSPYVEAGGTLCNDGYASAYECEPGSFCAEEHTAEMPGACQDLESGEYQPYFEAGGPDCNDGYASAYQCQDGDVCIQEHTADAGGLCGPGE